MSNTQPLDALPDIQLRDFIDVKKVQATLGADLQRLKDYVTQLRLTASLKGVEDAINHLQSATFTIAVVGEFKRGKSTFINALMGRDVLPSDILPCTATLNRIVYGLTPGITIEFKDGRRQEIGIDTLNDYVTKLTDEAADRAATIKEAIVRINVPYLQNNVVIYDTPGLNDEASMDEVTNSIVPQVDAAILVITPQAPFSQYEANFLEHKLLSADLGRVIFVVTRIDSLSPGEAKRMVTYVQERVEKNVKERAVQLYGADSEQYKAYVRKIGTPKVFGLAALPALQAKLASDGPRLTASRFPEFEAALQHFLTQERGPIMLQVPLNRVLNTANSVLSAVSLRENSLQMEHDAFEAAYVESTRQIADLRQKKRAETSAIDAACSDATIRVRPLIQSLQQELLTAADQALDSAPLAKDDIRGEENQKKTNARLIAVVTDAIKNASRLFADQVQNEVQQSLEDATVRLGSFAGEVDDVISSVVSRFNPISTTADAERNSGIEAGLAVFSVFSGITGIWTGYRKGGNKGAVIGGLAGMGITYGIYSVIAIFAIPLTLPLFVVAMILGALGGGQVVEHVMSGQMIKNFRERYRKQVHEQIAQQFAAQGITTKVNDEITTTFNKLKAVFSEEIEEVLDNTQKTLNDLRDKHAHNVALTDEEHRDLAEIRAQTQRIQGNAQRLAEQIVAIQSV